MRPSVPVIVALFWATTTAWGQDDLPTSGGEDDHCLHDKLGPACGEGAKAGPVTEDHKKEILHTHNLLRSKVASGNEKRGSPGPQPPATNMRKMIWSDACAKMAQRAANRCISNHTCLILESKEQSGQNLYYKATSGKDIAVNYTKAIMDWYNEVQHFDNAIVDKFGGSSNNETIGHYTQVVWATTTEVGCGHTIYKQNNGMLAILLLCNYFPSGNYPGVSVYKKGKPTCSCDKQYPALCC